ncbi:hypothetical protein EW026_g8159 [Hermanssonia centrifuga]|uniref:Uncharacterized protein n=1 Tax=Hermanssonia centrifuga TaxID=98765 RepID=A0A4S4K5B0_9APHY|nr:hypothetical protein EW026_g8159 [Hermanssonia centrifuga]
MRPLFIVKTEPLVDSLSAVEPTVPAIHPTAEDSDSETEPDLNADDADAAIDINVTQQEPTAPAIHPTAENSDSETEPDLDADDANAAVDINVAQREDQPCQCREDVIVLMKKIAMHARETSFATDGLLEFLRLEAAHRHRR